MTNEIIICLCGCGTPLPENVIKHARDCKQEPKFLNKRHQGRYNTRGKYQRTVGEPPPPNEERGRLVRAAIDRLPLNDNQRSVLYERLNPTMSETQSMQQVATLHDLTRQRIMMIQNAAILAIGGELGAKLRIVLQKPRLTDLPEREELLELLASRAPAGVA